MTTEEIKQTLLENSMMMSNDYIGYAFSYINNNQISKEELNELIEGLDVEEVSELFQNLATNKNLITLAKLKDIIFRLKGFSRFFYESDFRKMLISFHRFNYTTKEVESILIGAKRKIDLSDKGFVYYTQETAKQYVEDVVNAENHEVFARFKTISSDIYNYLTKQNVKGINLSATLKNFYLHTENYVGKTDDETAEYLTSRLDVLEKILAIYRVMIDSAGNTLTDTSDTIHYVKVENGIVRRNGKEMFAHNVGRLADHIMNESILKIKTSIDKFNAEHIQEFIKELQRYGEKDAFNSDEVNSLLMEAASILPRANAAKLRGVRKALNNYVVRLATTYSNDEKLANITAKALMLKVRSLTIETPKNISEATELLFGKTAKETIEDVEVSTPGKHLPNELSEKAKYYVEYAKKSYIYKFFPDLKISNTGIDTHRYIVTTRPSELSVVNINTLYGTTKDIVNCLYKAHYGESNGESFSYKAQALKLIGYDINSLYTADNVFDLFPSALTKGVKGPQGVYLYVENDIGSNMINNIKLLSKIISVEDVQKIIQHNVNVVFQNPKTTFESLREIFKKGKTKDQILQDINEFVNSIMYKTKSATSISDQQRRNVRRKIKLDKTKIEIDDLTYDENEILELLSGEDFAEAVKKINVSQSKVKKPRIKEDADAVKLEEAIESGELSSESVDEEKPVFIQKNYLDKRYQDMIEPELYYELINAISNIGSDCMVRETEFKFMLRLYLEKFASASNLANLKNLLNQLKGSMDEVSKRIEDLEIIDKLQVEEYYEALSSLREKQKAINIITEELKGFKNLSKEQRRFLAKQYGAQITEDEHKAKQDFVTTVDDAIKVSETKKNLEKEVVKSGEALRSQKRKANLLRVAAERIGITFEHGVEITKTLITQKEKEADQLVKKIESLEKSIAKTKQLIKTTLGDKFEDLTDKDGRMKRPRNLAGKMDSKITEKTNELNNCENQLNKLLNEIECLKNSLDEAINVF